MKVSIFEVGVRDGIQNESRTVSFEAKVFLATGLLAAGVRDFELGAFVRPDRVPQMADTDRLFQAVRERKLRLGRARAWSLVPNQKGLERAIAAGVKHIAVFTAASETFNQRNIGMSIRESLRECGQVIAAAKKAGIQVRGYVSTAFTCPFEGKISPKKALRVVETLAELGAFQISIGDTIGAATPRDVDRLFRPALMILGEPQTAAHFHDTRGTALANSLRALELGVRTLDSSAGGLGGCPFAPGATGNLATEDLVYMLDGMGIQTGIQFKKLCEVSLQFAKRIQRPLTSRALQAFLANQNLTHGCAS